jgi:hypothetical protein
VVKIFFQCAQSISRIKLSLEKLFSQNSETKKFSDPEPSSLRWIAPKFLVHSKKEIRFKQFSILTFIFQFQNIVQQNSNFRFIIQISLYDERTVKSFKKRVPRERER